MSTFKNRFNNEHESDNQIANGLHQHRELMCCADGCPNRWSVDGTNGKCCSPHAWADKQHWPAITRRQLDDAADRAVQAQMPVAVTTRVVPQAERIAALRRMSRVFGSNQQPKQWAYDLKRQDEHNEGSLDNGLPITPTQRECYQAVTGKPFVDMETDSDTPF